MLQKSREEGLGAGFWVHEPGGSGSGDLSEECF